MDGSQRWQKRTLQSRNIENNSLEHILLNFETQIYREEPLGKTGTMNMVLGTVSL